MQWRVFNFSGKLIKTIQIKLHFSLILTDHLNIQVKELGY